MKPFDLEKAKAGAPVQTRDGRPARILCFDKKNDDYPIVTLVKEAGCESICSHALTGLFTPVAGNNLDLVMAPVEHEGWVNLYRNGKLTGVDRIVYETQDEAIRERLDSGYITTVKITWEE